MSNDISSNDTDQDELQFLMDLYQQIGERLCDHLGHDWEELELDPTVNIASKLVRCTRCNETRRKPLLSSSSTKIECNVETDTE